MTKREFENYKMPSEQLDTRLSQILHDATCEQYEIDPKTMDAAESKDLMGICEEIVHSTLYEWEVQTAYWNDERDSKKKEKTMKNIDASLRKKE